MDNHTLDNSILNELSIEVDLSDDIYIDDFDFESQDTNTHNALHSRKPYYYQIAIALLFTIASIVVGILMLINLFSTTNEQRFIFPALGFGIIFIASIITCFLIIVCIKKHTQHKQSKQHTQNVVANTKNTSADDPRDNGAP